MPEMFKDQGYVTHCIGKWHLGDQPEFMPTRHGFDHYFGLPYSNDMGPAADGTKSNLGDPLPTSGKKINKGQPPLPLLLDEKCLGKLTGKEQVSLTEQYTQRAVEFINQHQQKPFFLYMPHTAVHFPLYPSEKFQRKSPHGYYSDWVEEVDWSVGEVLKTLDSCKLKEKTLIIFTADNGGTPRGLNFPLRGHKASTWEGGMRVVTICRFPGKIPAGTQTDELLSNMDFLPTFAHLIGAKLPSDKPIDGKNIWPILSGEPNAKTPHDHFYFFKGNNLEAVRYGPWKLHLKEQQLFHLLDDVAESMNVTAKHADIVQQLLALAEKSESDLGTNKPGPGCRPAGTVNNPQPIINYDETIRKEFQ
jgi:arylsulfatase A-like enzyme